MARKLLVLLNESAGSAGDLAAIERAFADLGAQPIVRVFTKETCGGTMAEVARAAGEGSFAYDALVVGGGDGTIGAAAAALAGTHVPLGILPMGTLNHFARDLGLPLRLPEAARIAAEGTERRVDVGLVNGRVFVNNSSIGIYPFLVAGRTREQRRHGLGKMAATAIAVARALRRSHWRRCTVTANGEKRSVRTACIFVGNNFYDLTRLGSRARLDEGALSIHIVKRQSWLGLIILPIIVGLGRARPERDIETIAAKDAVIASRKRHLRVAIDGEAVILATPLRYESLPGRLIVRCPPEAASSVPTEPDGP